MQDGFLFDSDDPKQRGVGCDSLCADDKRLKFKWAWNPFHGKGIPCQCSDAELENGWSFQAVFWHKRYEARVKRYGHHVGTYDIRSDESTPESPTLLTRIDAQLKAEELFKKIGEDIVRQCN